MHVWTVCRRLGGARETNPICGEFSDHAMALGFNDALVTSSRGLLPPVQATQMRYAAHANAALRCLAHEVAHIGTECALVLEGRLSMARAKSHDPQLFKAAQEGMVWRVIAREALEIHGVAQLIQSASNTSGHLQRGELDAKTLETVFEPRWSDRDKKSGVADAWKLFVSYFVQLLCFDLMDVCLRLLLSYQRYITGFEAACDLICSE